VSAIYYPPANIAVQWYADTFPGVDMGGVDKVLLHSTEGSSWPTYADDNGVAGAKAPQVTYHATGHRWRQHFPLNRSARALMDPQGTPVRENRDKVVQVEIIASADRRYAAKHGLLYVEDLDQQAIDDLGEFIAFMHREWGVPLVKAPLWLPYPQSYGNSDARMTSAEYDAFRGVLGHMHASGNLHGDPGALPINQIMVAAAAGEEDYMATDAAKAQLDRIELMLAQQFVLEGKRWAQTQDTLTAHDKQEDGRYAELHTVHQKVDRVLQELVDDPASPVTAEFLKAAGA
jgi:hypothetical protein